MSTASNILLAAVVGVAVGIGGGYALWGQGETTAQEADGGAHDGEGGVTPSQFAASVPNGTWCKVQCGASQACSQLDQIQSLALADLPGGRISPGMFTVLNDLLLKCAINQPPANVGGQEHCQKVGAAKAAALQHDWALCIQHMQHGH
jgi:hypothetical protein